MDNRIDHLLLDNNNHDREELKDTSTTLESIQQQPTEIIENRVDEADDTNHLILSNTTTPLFEKDDEEEEEEEEEEDSYLKKDHSTPPHPHPHPPLLSSSISNKSSLNFTFHVGVKIKSEKNKKKVKKVESVSLSLSSLVVPKQQQQQQLKVQSNQIITKATHSNRNHSLSSRRQNIQSSSSSTSYQYHHGEIGGTDFFINLFNGNMSCSKLLRDSFRVSSSIATLPTSPPISNSSNYNNNNYVDDKAYHQLLHDDDEDVDIEMIDNNSNNLSNGHSNIEDDCMLTIESIIAEEDESSSDEEKTYIKSLRERKTLEESEKGFNRVLREKIEQANINRMFFEPNRKKMPVKDQQLQDFLEQDVFTATPLPKGFNASECTEGTYDTLYYTIHPLRLGETVVESGEGGVGEKKNAEDVIKQGVPTPQYSKVQPYIPYNVNVSRRFMAAYKSGYIQYNTLGNSLSSQNISNKQRNQESPKNNIYNNNSLSSSSLISSPPSTPLTSSVNSALSLVHQSSYVWKKVSDMFNTANWIPQEMLLFEELIYIYGSDWTEISRLLCGSKSPIQIYRTFNKHQHTEQHVNQSFVDEWKRICFICFLANSSGKRSTHHKNKKTMTPLACCFSCERVFHIDCLDPPLIQAPTNDWYCSNDCGMTCQIKCNICKNDDHEDSFVICDGCNNGYHIYCLSPPLSEVPDDKWDCYNCSSSTINKNNNINNNINHHSILLIDDLQKLERSSNNNNNEDDNEKEEEEKQEDKNIQIDDNNLPLIPSFDIMDSNNNNNNKEDLINSPIIDLRKSIQSPILSNNNSLSSSSTSIALQFYQHIALNINHNNDCPNHPSNLMNMTDDNINSPLPSSSNSSSSSSSTTTTTTNMNGGGGGETPSDNSNQEQYSSSFVRVLGKEGQKVASTAISKPFHTLKQLGNVCLACLTSVGLFEDSPNLSQQEIYDYKELLSEDIGEDECDLEAVLSKRFDIMLAAIPIAIDHMISNPLLLDHNNNKLEINNNKIKKIDDQINIHLNQFNQQKEKEKEKEKEKDIDIQINNDDDSNNTQQQQQQLIPLKLTESQEITSTAIQILNDQINSEKEKKDKLIIKNEKEEEKEDEEVKKKENKENNNNVVDSPPLPPSLNNSGTFEGSKILLQMANNNNNNNNNQNHSTTSSSSSSYTQTKPSTSTTTTTISIPSYSIAYPYSTMMSYATTPTVSATTDYIQQQMMASMQNYPMSAAGSFYSSTPMYSIPYLQPLAPLSTSSSLSSTSCSTTTTPTNVDKKLVKQPIKRPRKPKLSNQQQQQNNEDDLNNTKKVKKRSTINETIGIARGRRSRLSDGTAEIARWWIFSGNPKDRPELNNMRPGLEMEWKVRQHADNIRMNDSVYIWLCGKHAGISATAVALQDPVRQTLLPSDTHYQSSKPNLHHTVNLQVVKVFPTVLPKNVIAEQLPQMTIIRAPLATNFWVTDEESDVLSTLSDQHDKGQLDISTTTSVPPSPAPSNRLKDNVGELDNQINQTLQQHHQQDSLSSTKDNFKPLKPKRLTKKMKKDSTIIAPIIHKCTICSNDCLTSTPSISCDSCGKYYHNDCFTEVVDKSIYSYWICFNCCMSKEEIENCKMVIGWLELKSKCKKILVGKCEAFFTSHKKIIYSGNKQKALSKMTLVTCQLNTFRVLLSKIVNQRYSIWYHHNQQPDKDQEIDKLK